MAPHTPSTEAIDSSMGSANGIQGARHVHMYVYIYMHHVFYIACMYVFVYIYLYETMINFACEKEFTPINGENGN